MKMILQIVDPDGQIAAELPLDDSRVEIASLPGHTYRLIVGEAGDANTPVPSGPRALRIDNDLVIDQIPSGYPIQLSNFFGACPADQLCTLEIAMPGKEIASLTPLNEPLAAYAEGGFLMYAGTESAQAAIPKPPEAESTFNWRPLAALGGGIAILGAAGGSGGSGAADASAPVAPDLVSGTTTNSPTPVFSGTAEPGSTIALTLSIGQSGDQIVRYSTVADSQGAWSINTLTDVPDGGVFPENGIPADQSSTVSIIATDSAGNASTVTNGNIVVDAVAPDRPAINTQGDLSPSSSAALNGIAVVNRAEIADGATIDGTAEANSLITVAMTASNGYSFTGQTVTDANGQFSLPIAPADLPAQQGNVGMTITATDAAGNDSIAFSSQVLFDQSLSNATASVSSVQDDIAPGIGQVGNGGFTNDTTPTVAGTVIGTLASDESVLVLRDGQALGTATLNGPTWSFDDNLNAISAGPQGQFTYTAQMIDNAGNTGNGGQPGAQSAALAISVDTTAPAQSVTISQVIDDSEGIDIVIGRGRTTSDTTPQVTVTLDDVLAPGETLQLLRTQAGVIEVVGEAGSDPQQVSFDFDDTVVSGSPVTYQAQVLDAAGLAGIPSTVYVVSITDPFNNLP